MKIFQNIYERRNIVVTEQFQKAYSPAELVVPNDKANATIKVHKRRELALKHG